MIAWRNARAFGIFVPGCQPLAAELERWAATDISDCMRLGLLVCFAAMIFSRRADAQASSPASFWAWFVPRSARIHAVRDSDDPLLDSLAAALSRVHSDLTYELGPPVASGAREFVVSAGGIRDAFPAVEALVATAPALPDWRLVKFRPRRAPLNVLTLRGRQFDPARARFVLVRDAPGKVGVVLFLEQYNRAEHYVFAEAGYLLLDEALGEYAVETRLGAIDFLGADSPYFSRSRPLAELAEAFDEQFSRERPWGPLPVPPNESLQLTERVGTARLRRALTGSLGS